MRCRAGRSLRGRFASRIRDVGRASGLRPGRGPIARGLPTLRVRAALDLLPEDRPWDPGGARVAPADDARKASVTGACTEPVRSSETTVDRSVAALKRAPTDHAA